MNSEKFKLPASSYDELMKIIIGYGQTDNPVSLDEISKTIGMHRTTISANTGFLTAAQILESGQRKTCTENGRRLARALEHEVTEEIQEYWRSIIDESEFLGKLLTAIKIRKGMDESTFEAHIAYSAGQPKKTSIMTGARTIIEILKNANLINIQDGKVLLVEKEMIDKMKQENGINQTNIPITKAFADVQTNFSDHGLYININIDLSINCQVSELDGLGEKIKEIINKIISKND